MSDLTPGPLQPDPSHDIRNHPLPEPKTVDIPPLAPPPISGDDIKKGELAEIESLKRKNTIAQLLKGQVAINTPGDAMKYGIGMTLGVIARHFMGC